MNDRDTFRELRAKIDGNDPFMTGGHGIKKIRQQKRSVPEWTQDDKRVQEVLLRSFPKLASEERQRRRAAIWMRIIHLYYRMGMTDSQVAAEMTIDVTKVKETLTRIRRASQGQNTRTKQTAGVRPRGRPKRQ